MAKTYYRYCTQCMIDGKFPLQKVTDRTKPVECPICERVMVRYQDLPSHLRVTAQRKFREKLRKQREENARDNAG